MNNPMDPNNSGLQINQEIKGYRIQSIHALEQIEGFLYQLIHTGTGARHLHISVPDKENTFGVTFKTVPADATGVAHILEHTVLCGSRKYPVRDPFFSMLKRSLSTFMNAFTASDWTMYPFATQNSKDFYNLMDVYLDAAFFPKLDALSFKQEGHRLEIEDDAAGQAQLVYKGVVYNEMKGAMSSPSQVMGRALLNALYPDTTYCNNSGGDPEVMPRLTHAQLTAFHQRHYHPSNAYFYTYGHLPLTAHLAVIDKKVMAHFSAIDPETDVPMQPRWSKPKTARYTYPLAPGEDPAKKHQVCLAWLIHDICDTFELLSFSVLEQILLGNAASPLRKALMDSGLGSALSDAAGFDADNRDTLFACGLKDVTEASAPKIEQLTMAVFKELVNAGIERELIDSAIHQIEFHRKEITNTPYPYGIKLLLTLIGTWLHGGAPERILLLDNDLQRLRAAIDKGPFLEGYIQTYFIDNPHRVRLVLSPDTEMAQTEENRVRAELRNRFDKLSSKEKETIRQDTERLEKRQEQPEDIACLPTLALSDIPTTVPTYAPSELLADRPLWCYRQPTSGIFYFNGVASAALTPELLPWVPFFCYLFTKIGTRKHDYTEMARKIDAVTGGLSLGTKAQAPFYQPETALPLVSLSAKCLGPNIGPMLAIIEELIAQADFSDPVRLNQLLGEYQAGLEAMVVQNGHRLAISLSSRTFSRTGALSEIWSGVHQVTTIRAFTKEPGPKRTEGLIENLSAIARAIFTPDNFVMTAIGEQAHIDSAITLLRKSPALGAFNNAQPLPRLRPQAIETAAQIPYEGWSTSSAVAFVAQTIPTVTLAHGDAPSLSVLSKILRSLYLHREIREKGGAYGGFALYNSENGLFSLASYRDPHIVRTLNVYAEVVNFVQTHPLEDADVHEAILQVCSEIDKPDAPGPGARRAFFRLISGMTDPVRQKFKQQLLTVTADQVRQVALKYFDGKVAGGVAVIAGQEQLERANKQLADKPLALNTI
jgi:presequence protease